MPDNEFSKILELRQMQVRRAELEAELRAFLKQMADTNRIFADNERVAIYNYKNELIGEGIVTKAWVTAEISDYSIGRFYTNEMLWEQEVSQIRYQVMGIKKDGTISFRTALGRRSYSAHPDRDFSHFIKKLN